MSSMREAPREGSTHALAFRVMRLCRPSLHVDLSVNYEPSDMWYGEDETVNSASHLSGTLIEGHSISPQPAVEAMGIPGTMVLPQAFGSIYLGETFCSYISVTNHSKLSVTNVAVKAELQTERQRVSLLDKTKKVIEAMEAGGRYDFIIEHDIKELGAHTLLCSASYVDGYGEQKYLPQFFKFTASNPISVRTKVRTVKVAGVDGNPPADVTFLEACIENNTKNSLFLDAVKLEASSSWTAVELTPPLLGREAGEAEEREEQVFSFEGSGGHLVAPSGGSHHFLFQLTPCGREGEIVSVGPTGGGGSHHSLGKLEITWRSAMGEPGRLQTQQILGTSPISTKEVELGLLELPKRVVVEQPFFGKIPGFKPNGAYDWPSKNHNGKRRLRDPKNCDCQWPLGSDGSKFGAKAQHRV